MKIFLGYFLVYDVKDLYVSYFYKRYTLSNFFHTNKTLIDSLNPSGVLFHSFIPWMIVFFSWRFLVVILYLKTLDEQEYSSEMLVDVRACDLVSALGQDWSQVPRLPPMKSQSFVT